MAGRFIILGDGEKYVIGEYNKKEYTRRLPGHPDSIVARCKKPHYTKARKKQMAQRPQVKRFCEVNAEAHAIWNNPELKAEWEAKHRAALREGSKHNTYVPVRLWDYIRHEINVLKAKSDKNT